MGATRQPRMLPARSGGAMNGMFPAQRTNQIGAQTGLQPFTGGMITRRAPQEELGFGAPPQPAAQITPFGYRKPVLRTDAGMEPSFLNTMGTQQPQAQPQQQGGNRLVNSAMRMFGFNGMPRSPQEARDAVMGARDRIRQTVANGNQSPVMNPDGSVANAQPGMRELADSFWTGKTLAVPTSSGDYAGLRGDLQSYLRRNIGGIQAQRPQGPAELGPAGQFNMQFSNIPEFSRGDIRDVSGPQLGRGDMVRGSRIGQARLGPAAMAGTPMIGQANIGDAPQVGFGGFSAVDQVNAPGISDQGVNIQSVDQLGGANSPFLQNVINQLQPAWDRQRERALAQAKESAGNLTGSGYGAMLARGLDDQMARERSELMGFAGNALQMELGRQGQLASMAQQRNLASPELNLRAQLANQDVSRQLSMRGGELGLQAGLANQDTARQFGLARFGAEQDRLNRQAELGQQTGLANADASNRFALERYGTDSNRLAQQAQLQQQARLANQGTRQAYDLAGAQLGMQGQLANQGMDASFLNSLLQRGGLMNAQDQLRLNSGLANMENTRAYDLARFQGGLDRYRTDADLANSDAQRISSLLGATGTAGVSSDEIVQTGGAAAVLPALGGLLGGMGGGGMGSPGGSGLLGGGGIDGQGNWGLVGDLGGWLGGKIGIGDNEVGGNTASMIGAGLGAVGKKVLPGMAMWKGGDMIQNAMGRNNDLGRIGNYAAKGAAIGSIIPGLGTLAGGAIGAGVGAVAKPAKKLGRWLSGTGMTREQANNAIPSWLRIPGR